MGISFCYILYGIKNTLDYNPRKAPEDMRIMVNQQPTTNNNERCSGPARPIIVTDLFKPEENIYNKILKETNYLERPARLWHGEPDKARKQNTCRPGITIGTSFGCDRIISFQHAETGTTIDIPLKDGYVNVS